MVFLVLVLIGCGTRAGSDTPKRGSAPPQAAPAPPAKGMKITLHVPDMAKRLDLG
jgi:hypothetical protein